MNDTSKIIIKMNMCEHMKSGGESWALLVWVESVYLLLVVWLERFNSRGIKRALGITFWECGVVFCWMAKD